MALGLLFGATCTGALLGSMPGMAVGAIVGTVRRRHLTLAYDAPRENAFLRFLVPALIAVVIWVLYFYLVLHHVLPALLKQEWHPSTRS